MPFLLDDMMSVTSAADHEHDKHSFIAIHLELLSLYAFFFSNKYSLQNRYKNQITLNKTLIMSSFDDNHWHAHSISPVYSVAYSFHFSDIL